LHLIVKNLNPYNVFAGIEGDELAAPLLVHVTGPVD
jgi:hypothetical protein